MFAKLPVDGKSTLVVLETKGAHLKNEDTAYKQKLLAGLSHIYKDETSRRVGELELVSSQGQSVICDLIFDQAWQGTLAQRYFS